MLSDFFTERLSVTNSIASEAKELDRIRESVKYIAAWMSSEADEMDETLEDFFKYGFSDKEHKDSFQLMTIRDKTLDCIIGYFCFTHRYPDDQTLWLSLLAVDSEVQKKGFGREAIDALIEEINNQTNYLKISLFVDLKNWPALKFWLSVGFDRITKYKGDSTFSDNTYAGIVLDYIIKS